MKKIRKMNCRELKNFGDSLFGMKRRLSIRKRNINVYDDLNPLADSTFNEDMKSCTETIFKCNPGNEEERHDYRCRPKKSYLPFKEQNPIRADTSNSFRNDEKYAAYSTKETSELQEDWSFTWYDFDGRGKITKKDMSTVMKSLYEIIRHNAKNRHSKFIDQYRLHLVLMPTDLSNVQGLDLATSYEQIYQVKSVLTSLTNLSIFSSNDDFQDWDNTLNINTWKKEKSELLLKHQSVGKKSFSGRCFEELQEMRARHKEKRSKSTPTKNSKNTANDDNNLLNIIVKNEKLAISSSLMSLAGSTSNLQCTQKSIQKKQKNKSNKSRHCKRNSKINKDFNRTKILSTSLQNISINGLEIDLLKNEENYKEKHIKTKNKQKLKKDLGRMHVEEWLLNELPCNLSESNKPVLHHYHHHYYKQSDDIPPIQYKTFNESKLENERNKTFEYHNHIHVHHHHHHYFY